MRLTPPTEQDPMVAHVRTPHFVEIYFRGRRLDDAFVTEVAVANMADLRQLVEEAANSNDADTVKAPYRYLVRVYEYRLDRHRNPRRGRRIMDYVPRGEEGRLRDHGYAA